MDGIAIGVAIACGAPGVGIGLFLVYRRQYVIGALLVTLGLLPLVLVSSESPAPGSASLHGLALVLAVVGAAGWIWYYVPVGLLGLLFPDGRADGRWKLLLVGWGSFVVLFHVAVALDPESYGAGADQIQGQPPLAAPTWLVELLGFSALALLLALLIGSVMRVVGRLRQGTDVVRRQIKWFSLSVLLLPLVLVATWIAYLLTDVADVVVVVGLLAVYVSVPITVAIAVLRHNLYDVDRLVSRTVSYIVLSAVVAALFAATTVVVGAVVGAGSDLAVAIGTLASAVALGLLHRRVQAAVDGRFDRGRREALAEVERFVDSVRQGSALPEEIDDCLRRALRDPALAVVYRVGSHEPASWRDVDGQQTEHPERDFLDVSVGGRLLASISYDTAAQRPGLMRDVLREAHMPLELARSRIELKRALEEVAASRSRLLRTGDAERRRLERDLHDGAQQRLVAIGMSLRLAQQRAERGDPMQEAVGQAVGELQEAVRDLRRLANGIRPRSLDEGLSPAIRSLVRSCPVAVDLQIEADGLSDALVTTAYYVVAEGLTNALKHAAATGVLIEVKREDGRLRVSVADDGRGGAGVTPGSGLAGLRDRVAATGGDLSVASPAGRGTKVEAVLPCGS